MTTNTTPLQAALEQPSHLEGSHLAPVSSFRIEDHPLPDRHVEIWRFTPAEPIMALVGDRDDDPATSPMRLGVQAPDGVFVQALAAGEAPWGTVLTPVDRPSALIETKVADALHLRIPAGAHLDEAVTVSLQGTDAAHRSYSHIVIEAEPDSQAIVVLHHQGMAQHLGNVEVLVGDRANLTVVSLQDWDDASLHAGLTQASVGRDAHYRHVAVSFGGAFVRLQNDLSYAGPGGTAELYGLYLADAGQHLEHRLMIDQNQSHTTCRVDYRGALQGQGAHSVWVGDVLIRRGVVGIDSYEQNRNLVLTDGCVADSVPNLEIETGDIIGAGHSSSTGRFDEEQLFYLKSRGIPEDLARRLIVQGFFQDIIRRIGVPVVEAHLTSMVDAELDALAASATDSSLTQNKEN
jgi:Fe-S cluster assembly protein SufD